MPRIVTPGRMMGRLYGDPSKFANLMFYPEMGGRGEPFLNVRTPGKGPDMLSVKGPTSILVELDEHPGIPYLAWARLDDGMAVIEFAGVELRAGEGELPELGGVRAAAA